MDLNKDDECNAPAPVQESAYEKVYRASKRVMQFMIMPQEYWCGEWTQEECEQYATAQALLSEAESRIFKPESGGHAAYVDREAIAEARIVTRRVV